MLYTYKGQSVKMHVFVGVRSGALWSESSILDLMNTVPEVMAVSESMADPMVSVYVNGYGSYMLVSDGALDWSGSEYTMAICAYDEYRAKEGVSQ
jgi:hypothetical protein